MTDEIKQAIWDILVREAGAPENGSMQRQFLTLFPECREFRFQGDLGFGGKIWYQPYHTPPVDVNCYQEHLTPERKEIIERTNAALAKLDFGETAIKKVWTAQ